MLVIKHFMHIDTKVTNKKGNLQQNRVELRLNQTIFILKKTYSNNSNI